MTAVSTALQTAQSATSIEAAKKAVTAAQKAVEEAGRGLQEWQRGIVFAGFGVWVLIVLRTIGRINAGGLNARFLINASLRAGAAMMLGFFAGVSGFFTAVNLGDIGLPTAYFLIGLFYPLFVEQLRDFALKLFKWNRNITSEMPSNWVDGVDDDTQDILAEVNVIGVQHLAMADPGLLTVRTLFEFDRAFDFVDQAMLIEHFREKIVELRLLRIRGVTDFVTALEPAIRKSEGRADAEKLIEQIVAATGKSEEAVRSFARTRLEDFRVNLFIGFVRRRKPATASVPAQQPATTVGGEAGPRMPIQTEPQPSFSAFAVPTAVKSRLEDELRREAWRDAARFRAENPDAQPTDDVITASYDQAYPLALERATTGANPKPGKETRDVYTDAFKGALA